MWAEMATNYYPNANGSLMQKLFSTDAGYIPVPQRIIGLVGNQLNLPAASIPYFYTWSAIILTGMMVSSFCLRPFRKLINSDVLRFMVVLSVLMVADFESRTYINFTYFSAFFIAIIIALALVDHVDEVPWWAWFVPVLTISKPAVLATLPAMIVVATVSKKRFRWIAFAVIALCVVQVIQMSVSATAGTMPFRSNHITLLAKLIAAVKYFFGFLGGYTFGHSLDLSKHLMMLAGVGLFILSAWVIIRRKGNERALILVGLSLLFFNVLLNTFALSDMWNTDMAVLGGIPVYRHIIVGFFGSVLVVAGLFTHFAGVFNSEKYPSFTRIFAAVLFLIWFIASGWLTVAGMISRQPGASVINNSQWQNIASSIDSGASPLCVPVDPIGWMYQRNCSFLTEMPVWTDGQTRTYDTGYLETTVPAKLAGKNIFSAAVLIKPHALQMTQVELRLEFTLQDGSKKYYVGSKKLDDAGGLIMMTGKEIIPVNSISSVRLSFNVPVEIASAKKPGEGLVWMGF